MTTKATKKTKKTAAKIAPAVAEPTVAESSPAPAETPAVTVAKPMSISIRRSAPCPLCVAPHASVLHYFQLWQRRPVKTEVDDDWFYRHARMLAHDALAGDRG